MLGKLVDGLFTICLLSLGVTLTVVLLSFVSEIMLYAIKQFKEFKKWKKTFRLNAWKVKPELADRFLNLLADNDYKWMSGHKANEFSPLQDNAPLLFIEGATKRIYYTRYFSYPDNLEEEYNVTDVTEKLLEDMERGMALYKLKGGK